MESSKVGNKLEHLKSLKALTFMDDDNVKESFLSLYKSTHPGESDDQAKIFYEREGNFLKRILFASPKLQQATIFSLYCCFIDIITNGMTFEPAAGLMFIEVRGFNTAAYKETPVWEQRASNKLTASGELNLRMQLNQIKYADIPVIVYEGDIFKIGVGQDRKKYVIYEAVIPRKSKKIIASFILLTRPDNSIDVAYLTEDDIERFKEASLKNNSRGNNNATANELYTSVNGGIDPSFLGTKTMRHAFKTFPKARIIGSNTTLEDEDEASEKNMVADLGNVIESNIQQQAPAAASFTVPPVSIAIPGSNEIASNKTGGGVQLFDNNF